MPGIQVSGAFMRKWYSLALGLSLVCLIGADVGQASSFKVLPIRVFVNARDKSAVLEITNEDKRKLTLQMGVKGWSQDDEGIDQYPPTRDIVFFPRIVTLEPKESQIVRLGIRGKPDPEKERTYRFYITELPVEQPGGRTVLRFLFNVSLPIFISPVKPTTGWEVSKSTVAHRAIVATVTNHGNQHVMVTQVLAKATDAAGKEVFSGKGQGWYVLAGRSHSFELPLPEEACPAVRHLAVSVKAGRETIQNEFDVEPDAEQCEPPPDRTGGGQGGTR